MMRRLLIGLSCLTAALNAGAVTLSAGAATLNAGAAAGQTDEHGSGRYRAIFEMRADLPDHVVYRPAALAELGREKLGLYVFGNGGCSADGTSSRNHLLEIASHGYLAIASGVIPTGDATKAPAARETGAPVAGASQATAPAAGARLTAATATQLLTDAIDWAQRENSRRGSAFYGRIALDQIAVSGWSCGGLQALSAAHDPRVRTAVIMNSGFFNDGKGPIEGIVSDKALLASLHGSILYILGGPTDIAAANGTDDFRRIDTIPAALVNIPVGHGGTYMQPHGGVGAEVVTAWLDWQLKGKPKAAARFTGRDCGFCSDPRLSIERKHLP